MHRHLREGDCIDAVQLSDCAVAMKIMSWNVNGIRAMITKLVDDPLYSSGHQGALALELTEWVE